MWDFSFSQKIEPLQNSLLRNCSPLEEPLFLARIVRTEKWEDWIQRTSIIMIIFLNLYLRFNLVFLHTHFSYWFGEPFIKYVLKLQSGFITTEKRFWLWSTSIQAIDNISIGPIKLLASKCTFKLKAILLKYKRQPTKLNSLNKANWL